MIIIIIEYWLKVLIILVYLCDICLRLWNESNRGIMSGVWIDSKVRKLSDMVREFIL